MQLSPFGKKLLQQTHHAEVAAPSSPHDLCLNLGFLIFAAVVDILVSKQLNCFQTSNVPVMICVIHFEQKLVFLSIPNTYHDY